MTAIDQALKHMIITQETLPYPASPASVDLFGADQKEALL